ncbi:MAG: hypothetical protein V1740_05345 [Candidatus Woesearchaeota archaeon]
MPDKQNVKDTIDSLIENPLPYYELMAEHRFDLIWGRRWFPETREKVREVMRLGLIESVKELNEHESVFNRYIRVNHSGLLTAAQQVYKSNNGFSPWQMLLKDSGISINGIDQIVDELLGLKTTKLDYNDLMKRHGGLFKFALRFKDRTKNMIDEIKRKALARSIRRLHKQEKVNHQYAKINHQCLVTAAKFLYEPYDGKTTWQMAVEDAGITYPANHRDWSLNSLLEALKKRGDNPEDYRAHRIQEQDPGLETTLRKRFGHYGKAVILIGVPYLDLPNTIKWHHIFDREDISQLVENFPEGETAQMVFNALTLQFYDFSKYSTYTGKRLNQDDNGFHVCRRSPIVKGVDLSHLQSRRNLDNFAVEVSHGPYKSRFTFNGKPAVDESMRFYFRIVDNVGKM